MKILFWGLMLFALAFCLHLIIWRIRIPKRQTSALLTIFIFTLFIGLLGLGIISVSYTNSNPFILQKISECFHISLLFISFTLAYITTYSAIEVDSPSLLIVKRVAESGANGLEISKLEEITDDDLLVKPRIENLLTDKLIYLCGDKYKLTAMGLLIARVFRFYRKLLNAPKGG